MGQSTDALLVYGYHLGGGDGGWELQGLGEYDELPELPWYNEDSEDFQGDAEQLLLAQLAGFTETWESGGEGYFAREREAKARLGVTFETHCSGSYPGYLLIAKGITAHRGDVESIDFAELTAEVQQADADAKLRAALEVLGLTPKQERPGWMLCSFWGI
ncbi:MULTISPECIES: hypothetical protein [unclassified Streptomyces]|uniref:hypothetical protein n=1 Tax=unclassified Streptomyces TaxID=2593676 RepID=UPI002E291228|nr:hypothetical protein [Streptomyces sp. NBC_00228]